MYEIMKVKGILGVSAFSCCMCLLFLFCGGERKVVEPAEDDVGEAVECERWEDGLED